MMHIKYNFYKLSGILLNTLLYKVRVKNIWAIIYLFFYTLLIIIILYYLLIKKFYNLSFGHCCDWHSQMFSNALQCLYDIRNISVMSHVIWLGLFLISINDCWPVRTFLVFQISFHFWIWQRAYEPYCHKRHHLLY